MSNINPYIGADTEDTANRLASGLNLLVHLEDLTSMTDRSQYGLSLMLDGLLDAANNLVERDPRRGSTRRPPGGNTMTTVTRHR